MTEAAGSRPTFSAAVRRARADGRVAVIPDIKVRSPMRGNFAGGRDPVDLAVRFEAGGLLPFRRHRDGAFGGSLDLWLVWRKV